VDLLFVKNRFWERLIMNIGIKSNTQRLIEDKTTT
jgi:hypothetical protein